MSKYARVLDEGTVQIEKEAPSATERHPKKSATLFYRDLIQSLFPRSNGNNAGKVIAFSSYSPGEGVSHVVQSLAAELAASRNQPTLATTAVAVIDLALDGERFSESVLRECGSNLWSFSPPNHGGRIHELFRPSRETAIKGPLGQDASQPFEILRGRFAHVLIDCQSLKNSDNLAKVAASCDGVVLVVEADRTRPDQIELARRTIEAAQGTLVGCVLNQRKYPIPDWLYRRL
jgi:Mrp family chromosome partitioning ATPase